jgi:hypothetical protein
VQELRERERGGEARAGDHEVDADRTEVVA